MKKRILAILFISLTTVSCGGGGGGSSPTGPSAYTVSFSAATPSAGSNYVKMEQVSVSGDTVTIAVKAVSIAEPVGGLAVDVTYDTTKLSFVSASNGDVVSGNTASFVATDSSGTVIISASDVTDASPSSSGTLFTITFKGIAAGNGSVSLASSGLFSASGSVISGISWDGGTVTVQ